MALQESLRYTPLGVLENVCFLIMDFFKEIYLLLEESQHQPPWTLDSREGLGTPGGGRRRAGVPGGVGAAVGCAGWRAWGAARWRHSCPSALRSARSLRWRRMGPPGHTVSSWKDGGPGKGLIFQEGLTKACDCRTTGFRIQRRNARLTQSPAALSSANSSASRSLRTSQGPCGGQVQGGDPA